MWQKNIRETNRKSLKLFSFVKIVGKKREAIRKSMKLFYFVNMEKNIRKQTGRRFNCPHYKNEGKV